MQQIASSSSDIITQTGHNKQIAAASIASNNIEKTINKSTEAANALNKTENKNISEKKAETKYITERKTDKKLKENIAQENLIDNTIKKEAPQKTATLEAQKNYSETAPNDGIDSPTALEVAVQKQDILESVKSVKPDGTETYYFPVPVEVLTQLPPPGNLGLSAKMLDDIMKTQSEKAQKNATEENIIVKPSDDDVKKIYLNALAHKGTSNNDRNNFNNLVLGSM